MQIKLGQLFETIFHLNLTFHLILVLANLKYKYVPKYFNQYWTGMTGSRDRIVHLGQIGYK